MGCAPVRGRHLDASITSEIRRPETACAWQCEIITIHVRGRAAEHLAELVDPLLVSGVPTYLWWLGTPPFGKKELLDALRVCDGLVVDSARFEEPYSSFRRMSGLLKIAHHRLGLADVQWARLRPWRETIAQFFTPMDRRGFLSGISEIGVDYVGASSAPLRRMAFLSSALGVRGAGPKMVEPVLGNRASLEARRQPWK